MKALESLCEHSKDAGLVLSALRSGLTPDRSSGSQQTHTHVNNMMRLLLSILLQLGKKRTTQICLFTIGGFSVSAVLFPRVLACPGCKQNIMEFPT